MTWCIRFLKTQFRFVIASQRTLIADGEEDTFSPILSDYTLFLHYSPNARCFIQHWFTRLQKIAQFSSQFVQYHPHCLTEEGKINSEPCRTTMYTPRTQKLDFIKKWASGRYIYCTFDNSLFLKKKPPTKHKKRTCNYCHVKWLLRGILSLSFHCFILSVPSCMPIDPFKISVVVMTHERATYDKGIIWALKWLKFGWFFFLGGGGGSIFHILFIVQHLF